MSSTATSDSRRRQRDEDGDRGPEERPQQRPRLEDETLVEHDAEQVVRDSAFYRDDGDCILRVQDTLFKVHRHLLNYESSAFNGLFSLPRGPEGKIEGDHDSTPVILSGDTPDQVRAFFGYAYASPLELQYARISSRAIDQLLDTLKFTHKYGLELFEKWAAQAITHICTQRDLLKTCGPELYVALLEMDQLCRLPGVKPAIRKRWVSRLRHDDPALTLAHALDAADHLRFRDLQGDLYHLQLQRLDMPSADIPGAQAAPPLPTELSDVHKLRLLTGYRSLLFSWTRISATPMALVGSRSCVMGPGYHQAHCVSEWNILWDVAVHTNISASDSVRGDLIKNLEALQTSLVPQCRALNCSVATEVATRALPDLIKTVKTSMADHFLGPEAEAPTS
ncbi:hypothetical protein B0H13DRAFT_2119673 [Mycena leptocephala]|nr:hypothetical protein B0H13DRAFT_2119673 [Mycena leptocephala]